MSRRYETSNQNNNQSQIGAGDERPVTGSRKYQEGGSRNSGNDYGNGVSSSRGQSGRFGASRGGAGSQSPRSGEYSGNQRGSGAYSRHGGGSNFDSRYPNENRQDRDRQEVQEPRSQQYNITQSGQTSSSGAASGKYVRRSAGGNFSDFPPPSNTTSKHDGQESRTTSKPSRNERAEQRIRSGDRDRSDRGGDRENANYYGNSSYPDRERDHKHRAARESRSRSPSGRHYQGKSERAGGDPRGGRAESHEHDLKRKNFDFKLFLKQRYFESGIASYSNREKIVQTTQVDDIKIDEDTKVPDLPGCILIIQGRSIDFKTDALMSMLRKIESLQEKEQLECLIFIPEGLVSMVIGTKGRQIKLFKEESHSDIVVNQPVVGMNLRSVQVTGNLRSVTNACRSIYDWLERQAHTVEDFDENRTAVPMSRDQTKTTARFVVSEESQGYLIGKHGSFTKCMQENGIYMKCLKDKHNRALKSKEAVCSMYGTLTDIEHSTSELIKRLQSYYEAQDKDYKQVPLAILIPHNLVTKIIGAQGCLIKELVIKTGAQIRVCSSKNDPYTSEIVVTIDGTNDQKRRGAQAILEQVELFKNGGPILQTGQAWSSNLLNQMRNSVQYNEDQKYKGAKGGEDYRRRESYDERGAGERGSDRDVVRKAYRSRSRSRSGHRHSRSPRSDIRSKREPLVVEQRRGEDDRPRDKDTKTKEKERGDDRDKDYYQRSEREHHRREGRESGVEEGESLSRDQKQHTSKRVTTATKSPTRDESEKDKEVRPSHSSRPANDSKVKDSKKQEHTQAKDSSQRQQTSSSQVTNNQQQSKREKSNKNDHSSSKNQQREPASHNPNTSRVDEQMLDIEVSSMLDYNEKIQESNDAAFTKQKSPLLIEQRHSQSINPMTAQNNPEHRTQNSQVPQIQSQKSEITHVNSNSQTSGERLQSPKSSISVDNDENDTSGNMIHFNPTLRVHELVISIRVPSTAHPLFEVKLADDRIKQIIDRTGAKITLYQANQEVELIGEKQKIEAATPELYQLIYDLEKQ